MGNSLELKIIAEGGGLENQQIYLYNKTAMRFKVISSIERFRSYPLRMHRVVA